ncbi:MAG: hypothetical protein AAB676_10470 [Verrucomicrobiota bacterium]
MNSNKPLITHRRALHLTLALAGTALVTTLVSFNNANRLWASTDLSLPFAILDPLDEQFL